MTIFLILKTINLFCSGKDGQEYKKIYEYTNKIIKSENCDWEWKVKPNSDDFDQFLKIIINPINVRDYYDRCKSINCASKTIEAVDFILDKLNKIDNNTESIWNIIWHLESLKSVFLILDIEKDENPQFIFESINASGVKLKFSDLVRNFLLMDVSSNKQEILFKKYWEPIIDNIKKGNEDYIESFFSDFLTIQLGRSVNDKDLYKEFVQWYNNFGENKEQILQRIYQHSKVYKLLIFPDSNDFSGSKKENDKVVHLLIELKEIGLKSVNCFLFEVLLDFYNGVLKDINELAKVLNLMVIYVIRRIIFKIPSASLKKFMVSLYNRIFINNDYKNDYYFSIYAYLYSLGTDDALMPDDGFVEQIQKLKLYKAHGVCKYLLNVIQNGRYPENLTEQSTADNLSVEHIIPQNINSEERINSLGENYKEKHHDYVHRLGNLSLLSGSNNSSFSNKPFKEKKRFLIENNTQFTKLNQYLLSKDDDKFTFDDVDKRGQELALILKIKFNLISPNQEKIDNFHQVLCQLGDGNNYEKIWNSKIIKFSLFDNEPIKVPSCSSKDLLVMVAKELYKIDSYKKKIVECTIKGFYPRDSSKENNLQQSADKPGKHYKNIGSYGDNFVWINTSVIGKYVIELLEKFLNLLNVPLNALKIYVNEESYFKASFTRKQVLLRWIIKSLTQLNEEEILIFDKDKFPKNNNRIKFQVKSLKDIFSNYNLGNFKRDGVTNSEFFYCEYNKNEKKVYLTFQKNEITRKIVDCLIRNADLDFINDDSEIYCHVKTFNVSSDDSLGMESFIKSFKLNLKEIINQINELSIILKPIFVDLASKL